MEMSKLRVAERVAHGGHNIPAKDIERRFARSLRNLLNDFSYRADHTLCFMNEDSQPDLAFEQYADQRTILNNDHYRLLIEQATS